jgi:hypothetical protein
MSRSTPHFTTSAARAQLCWCPARASVRAAAPPALRDMNADAERGSSLVRQGRALQRVLNVPASQGLVCVGGIRVGRVRAGAPPPVRNDPVLPVQSLGGACPAPRPWGDAPGRKPRIFKAEHFPADPVVIVPCPASLCKLPLLVRYNVPSILFHFWSLRSDKYNEVFNYKPSSERLIKYGTCLSL